MLDLGTTAAFAAGSLAGVAADGLLNAWMHRKTRAEVNDVRVETRERGEKMLALIEAVHAAQPKVLRGGLDAAEMSARGVAAREEKALTREEGDSFLLDRLAERFGGIENAIAVREACAAWMPEKWQKAAENVERAERILGPVLKHVKFKQAGEAAAPASAPFVTG